MGEQAQIIEWSTLLDQARSTFTYLSTYLGVLTAPWTWVQVSIIVGLFFVSHIMSRLLLRNLIGRLHAAHPVEALKRLGIVLIKQRRNIIFLVLLWATVAVMRGMTWPSRSYLVGIVASLLSLWVILSVFSQMVGHRALARFVATVAWVTAALYLLGLLPQTIALLDAAAINIGQLRISVLLLLKAAFTLILLFWLADLASSTIERKVQDVEGISPTMRVLTTKFVRILLFLLAILMGFQTIGFDLTGLTVFSGAIGVGIGFGLQKVVSNLISGFILLLDKSIKPGDVIEVGETFGWITSLSARYVSVITRDGREYLIPNEDLITNQVVNWSYSDSRIRIELPFGVSYDANPHKVRKLAVAAAMKPSRVIPSPAPVCHMTGFGESSLDFILRFWIDDPAGGVANVRGEVLLALWDTFKDNGIEIPYPHRELLMRKPVRIVSEESEAAMP